MEDSPDQRLIVYGTLAPGEVNYFLLAGMGGTWERCVIKGSMGQWYGFKAFRWDPEGEEHPAWLLTSPGLPEKFPELDAFEGEAYQRTIIPAQVGSRRALAHIYEGKEID